MPRRALAATLVTTTLTPAAALAQDVFVSPGIVLAGQSGEGPMSGFSAGLEVTANAAQIFGGGALAQLEFDFDGGVRLNIGAQAFGPFVGAELGWSMTFSDAGTDHALHLAPFAGFGYINGAARFLFFTDTGVEYGGALTLKTPLGPRGLYAPSVGSGRPHRLADGRPLRPVVIDLGPRPPTDDAPDRAIADLPPASRHPLGRAWLRDARDEHAAIAAFAQLARHLTHHHAPPPLIARARRSARDEARHARACLDLASRLLGRHLALVTPPTDTPPPDLAALAAESHLDGHLNEGAAARVAAHAAARATHPLAARTQATIAREEARHATLGADIAAWAATTDPAARAALTAAAPDPDALDLGPAAPHGDRALWTAYGRPDHATHRDAWHAAT